MLINQWQIVLLTPFLLRIGGGHWRDQQECQTVSELAGQLLHSLEQRNAVLQAQAAARLGRVKMEHLPVRLSPLPCLGQYSAFSPALPVLSFRRVLLKGRAEAGVFQGPRENSVLPLQRGDTRLQKKVKSICTLLCQFFLSVMQTQHGPISQAPSLTSLHTHLI